MIAVSENTLLSRIRTALRRNGERLIKARGADMHWRYGPYYIVDDRNCIIAYGCTPTGLATELGLLRSDEQLK